MESAVEAFLNAIVFWLATLTAGYPVDAKWTVETPWKQRGEFYVFKASSRAIAEECRANPDYYIEVPSFLAINQNLFVDDDLVAGERSDQRRYIKSFYTALWVPCELANRASTVTWEVVTPSAVFAAIKVYPKIVAKIPYVKVLSQTIHLASSFSLVLLALFCLVVFLGKIDFQIVLGLALAGPFYSVYIAGQNAESYHLFLDYISTHRLSLQSVWIGSFFLCSVFRRYRLIHRFNYRLFVVAVAVALPIITCAETFDTILLGSMVVYPFLFLILADFMYTFFTSLFDSRKPSHYVQAFCAFLFSAFAVYEVFLVSKGISLILFGLAICFAYAFLILLISEEIMQTYLMKAEISEQLRAEQVKSHLLGQKKVVYESVVSTSQMVAHDIKRPFSVLLGLFALVKRAKSVSDVGILLNKYGGTIDQAFESVQAMIDDILSIGGNGFYQFEEVNIHDLLSEITESMVHWPGIHQIELVVRSNRGMVGVIDKEKVKRVIENIISNAVHAMNGRGAIVCNVKTLGDPKFIILAIHNTGSYIEASDIEHIFEPFVTTDSRRGRGLGLAICKKIVTDHGGAISCKSSLEGGTEFAFSVRAGETSQPHSEMTERCATFTAQALQSKSSSALDQGTPSRNSEESDLGSKSIGDVKELLVALGRKFNVLVVDDEQIYLRIIESYLSSHREIENAVTATFRHTLEALGDAKWLANFDLIILDVDLGGTHTGIEMAAMIKSAGFGGKICLHSNHWGFSTNPVILEGKADLFIPKPMSQDLFFRLMLTTLRSLPHV